MGPANPCTATRGGTPACRRTGAPPGARRCRTTGPPRPPRRSSRLRIRGPQVELQLAVRERHVLDPELAHEVLQAIDGPERLVPVVAAHVLEHQVHRADLPGEPALEAEPGLHAVGPGHGLDLAEGEVLGGRRTRVNRPQLVPAAPVGEEEGAPTTVGQSPVSGDRLRAGRRRAWARDGARPRAGSGRGRGARGSVGSGGGFNPQPRLWVSDRSWVHPSQPAPSRTPSRTPLFQALR